MAAPPPLLLLLVIFSGFLLTGIHSHASSSSGGVKFSYLGQNGPSKWGSLDPHFSICSTGKSQSPVDIQKSKVVRDKKLKPLFRQYHVSNLTLVDNLVNIGVHFGENAGLMISDGKHYKLKQMHWHTPSEHTIDGHHYDAELHLVHMADDGTYAVVGIVYSVGKPDSVVRKIQKKLTKLASHDRGYGYQYEIPLGKISMKQLQKKTRKYYKYQGSLTTPPCTESVTWYLLGKVKSISEEQIQALKVPLGLGWKSNSRPVQPLNGRQIHLYKH
ncbi:hypothetical protein M9H77_24058 [Catharanthus roseus]|uniref:Uncharacterized protein n=1 Tax=Catharanthus roseus TaxID=4058 RepID=A0ACC0AV22_CATRO|nr:hypothetical protein M9H77_24058 [Catharanthus roseus]